MKTKNLKFRYFFLLIVFQICLLTSAISGRDKLEIPKIPIGLDSNRKRDQWPAQRIGVCAFIKSTFDRTGGYESADASHFLFAHEENHNITLDLIDKGVFYFFPTVTGTTWFLQLFFYGMGESKLDNSASSWILQISTNILTADMWGLCNKEYKGVSPNIIRTFVVRVEAIMLSLSYLETHLYLET